MKTRFFFLLTRLFAIFFYVNFAANFRVVNYELPFSSETRSVFTLALRSLNRREIFLTDCVQKKQGSLQKKKIRFKIVWRTWNVLTADTFVTNGLRQYLAVRVIFNGPQAVLCRRRLWSFSSVKSGETFRVSPKPEKNRFCRTVRIVFFFSQLTSRFCHVKKWHEKNWFGWFLRQQSISWVFLNLLYFSSTTSPSPKHDVRGVSRTSRSVR